jgi:DNA-directed RNA polymerase subunit RPC12/RpoP
MKSKKPETYICPNCDNKIPKDKPIKKYGGYKANRGGVWCKTCGTRIK